jgi:hypothetical protein
MKIAAAHAGSGNYYNFRAARTRVGLPNELSKYLSKAAGFSGIMLNTVIESGNGQFAGSFDLNWLLHVLCGGISNFSPVL